MTIEPDIETHPWPPFIPVGAKVLIMGTFPPGSHRWSMDFYYPNRSNDFWYMMGLLYFGDRNALLDSTGKNFRLDEIKKLLSANGIAMNDTARKARRLKGNASDKFLEIIEPVPLYELLGQMPLCRDVATTGEKAAGIIASITGTDIPAMGEYTTTQDGLRLWRMPSTSRAYPLKLEDKAAFYRRLFSEAGVL